MSVVPQIDWIMADRPVDTVKQFEMGIWMSWRGQMFVTLYREGLDMC